MSREWTVVIRGDWYLPHFVNMLRAYQGNGEQTSCATEVIDQIEGQMVRHAEGSLPTTRLLAVIDVEDRDSVERLVAKFESKRGESLFSKDDDYMQAALREFANPTPLKPDEPMGLGAVVEDEKGKRWIAHDPDGGMGADAFRWLPAGSAINAARVPFATIAAVRVLSEGVAS